MRGDLRVDVNQSLADYYSVSTISSDDDVYNEVDDEVHLFYRGSKDKPVWATSPASSRENIEEMDQEVGSLEAGGDIQLDAKGRHSNNNIDSDQHANAMDNDRHVYENDNSTISGNLELGKSRISFVEMMNSKSARDEQLDASDSDDSSNNMSYGTLWSMSSDR